MEVSPEDELILQQFGTSTGAGFGDEGEDNDYNNLASLISGTMNEKLDAKRAEGKHHFISLSVNLIPVSA